MTKIAVGIDIGGTNTAIGLVNREGVCLESGVVSTTAFTNIQDYIFSVKVKIDELAQKFANFELAGIGIGAPNGNYYKGTVEHAPNLLWKGVLPLAEMVREFYQVPIVLTNDANAAALGEMLFGGAKEMKHFIVITLGTGVGSGIVVNGELLYGNDSFAGEVGHTIYDPNGRQCGCGRKGCLETYASAGGIKRTVFELLAVSKEPSELRAVSFDDMTAKKIKEAAERGDKIALEAFEMTGKILGLKLADSIAYTSPEAIFLFGGLAQAGDFIFRPTAYYMEANMLTIYKNKVKLLPSGLKEDNVAILGAAALIWKDLV